MRRNNRWHSRRHSPTPDAPPRNGHFRQLTIWEFDQVNKVDLPNRRGVQVNDVDAPNRLIVSTFNTQEFLFTGVAEPGKEIRTELADKRIIVLVFNSVSDDGANTNALDSTKTK